MVLPYALTRAGQRRRWPDNMSTNRQTIFYEPIGKLVVRFNDMEHFVSVLIAAITKDDPNVSMAMTAEVGFLAKLDILKAIAPFTIRDATLCKQLDDLLREMSECNTERNRMVHSAWYAGKSDTDLRRIKATIRNRKGLKGGFLPTSLAEIQSSIDRVEDAISHLCDYMRELQQRKISRINFVRD
jgi:hypothetical protein